MKAQQHRFLVKIPGHRPIRVIALGKYEARSKALRATAGNRRELTIDQLRAITVEQTGSVRKRSPFFR